MNGDYPSHLRGGAFHSQHENAPRAAGPPPYGRYPQHFNNDYQHSAGAVGTHTSGAIAGQARQQHNVERLPSALNHILSMQKMRLTELGFTEDFGQAASAVAADPSLLHLSNNRREEQVDNASDRADTGAARDNNSATEVERREKNRLKKKKQKLLKKQRKAPSVFTPLETANDVSSPTENVEIEYVPEEITFGGDRVSAQEFSRVFAAFQQLSSGKDDNNTSGDENEQNGGAAKGAETAGPTRLTKQPVDLHEVDEDDAKAGADGGDKIMSRRKLKRLLRPSVAELKRQVERPDVVEFHDVTSPDPKLLILLKAYRSTVPVPRHWCFKRKYLQGKRGIEKLPFELPDFIRKTGIMEMRDARAEKDDSKTLKQKMREKVRPKMGKIDINYQKLHDAFFKWQTKPHVSIHGDLYYEGKESEARLRDKKPGVVTNDLRLALGMPVGPNANKFPPPWLIAMQRYGPPPSYPELKVAGLNAPIPEGCTFGYHPGGWGKPPVDERGRPLYGDVFGMSGGAASGLVDKPDEYESGVTKLWGELYEDEEADEESEADEDEAKEAEAGEDGEAVEGSGLETPAGLATPSGTMSAVPSGLETPAEIELRKQRIEKEMEAGDDQRPLYAVLPERRVDKLGPAMLGSTHLYDLRGSSAANLNPSAPAKLGVSDVTIAIDPSELEQHGGLPKQNVVEKRYHAQVDEQRHQLEKEDFSDMVAEHAARQANKRRKQQDSKTTKKTKDFKF